MARIEDAELVRLGPQGRMVVPAEIRRELGLGEGSVLAARVVRGTLLLEPKQAILDRLRERFRGVEPGLSLAEELIDDRRHEAVDDADG